MLLDLVVSALFYDEVLLQDEFLALSDCLSAGCDDRNTLAALEQLLESGAFKILGHTRWGDERLAELAEAHPIEARARYITAQGSNWEAPFSPTQQHRNLWARCDTIITNKGLRRAVGARHPEVDVMANFAAEMERALRDEELRSWRRVCFGSRFEENAKRFADYIGDPSSAVRDLTKAMHQQGMASPNVRPSDDGAPEFNRSLAVMVAHYLFPNHEHGDSVADSLKRVAVSAFLKPFAEREEAVARFDAYTLQVPEGDPAPLHEIVPRAVGETGDDPCCIPLYHPNLADVLREVRMSPAGREFRRLVQAGASVPQDLDRVRSAWGGMCEALSRASIPPVHLPSFRSVLVEKGTEYAIAASIALPTLMAGGRELILAFAVGHMLPSAVALPVGIANDLLTRRDDLIQLRDSLYRNVEITSPARKVQT